MNTRVSFYSICHCYAVLTLLYVITIDPAMASNPVCSFNYTQRTEITAMSHIYPGNECEFILRAPNESNIVLNFTKLFGFKSAVNSSEIQSKSDAIEENSEIVNNRTTSPWKLTNNCLAELRILQLVNGSETTILQTLCEEGVKTPKVFHTNSSSIRLVYQWEKGRDSGFTLDFNYQQKKNNCKFECSDCPTGSPLVCTEGVINCQEGSNSRKSNCNPTVRDLSTESSSPTDYIPLFVIVPVVFILGTCVVIYYFVVLRVWRAQHSQSDYSMDGHSHLQTQASTASSSSNSRQSTIVYVPGCSPDRLQRQFVAVREKSHHRLQPVQQDLVVDLPPHIAISEDGEESFAQYQRLLQRPLNPRDVESVRPPPNRTVYDGESPPSYHSNSAVSLDHETSSSTRLLSRDLNGWASRLPSRRPPPTTSLSNLVNSVCQVSRTVPRRSRHPSADSTSSVSHSLDQPPPEYSVVMGESVGTPPRVAVPVLHCDRHTNNQL